MDPDRYFIGHNLKNKRRKQKFEYTKNRHFGWECSTLYPVAYRTIDFTKVLSDQFHPGSSLVESECIKTKGYRNSPEI